MTRSLANWEADGGTMDKPGGLRLDDLAGPNKVESDGLVPLGTSSLGFLCNLDSMIDLCWSRTERLLCNCSLKTGSYV